MFDRWKVALRPWLPFALAVLVSAVAVVQLRGEERVALVLLAAIVVHCAIRALSQVETPLSKRARPFVAGALGILGGVLEAVARGTPWRTAVLAGFSAGAIAALAHDARQALQGPSAEQPTTTPQEQDR